MNHGGIDPTGFGEAAADYVTHRAGFPPSLLDRLTEFGIGKTDQRVVDLGTGTGTLARQFAARGCRVTGIDPDQRMLDAARSLAERGNLAIEFVTGRAEATGLPSKSADVVTAGQCWHWFDGERAANEVLRLLIPEGLLAICHFDWIPLPDNTVQATEKLIKKHNPDWNLGGGHGMWPQWAPVLQTAGFVQLETFSFDAKVPYGHEAWRGRIRASAGITALNDERTVAFDRDLERLLAERFPGELHLDHRVWCLVARSPR